MKKILSESVNPNLPGIIVLSHGPFAVALVETANMVFGKSENLAALSFEEGDDAQEYGDAAAKLIESYPADSLVMLDLFGGTPCNQMMRYIQEKGRLVEIVAGMNLPMLVNALFARESMKGRELSDDAAANGQAGISRVDTEGFLNGSGDEDDFD